MRVPEPRPLHRYLTAVSLLGVAALAAFVPSALDFIPGAGTLYWLLFGLIALGELRPITVPRREAEISTSTAFSYAALLAFGTPAAAIAQAVGSLFTDIVRRRPLSRAIFNVAQFTLSLAAAGAVLSITAGVPFTHPLPDFAPSEIPAVVLAGMAFFAVNNCLAGTASALAHQAPILRTLGDDLVFQAGTAAVLLGLAPVIVVAADFSLGLLPLILLPLAAFHLGGARAVMNDHNALHDSLTGLPNRAFFRVLVEQAIRTRSRDGGRLAVMIMDLDRFKEINDGLGHSVGDLLLCEVGPRIDGTLSGSGSLARLGGDEFAVLLPDVESPAAALAAAARVTQAFERMVEVAGLELDVRASIGVACWPEHGTDVDTLIGHADAAMYRAKQTGGSQALYRPLHGSSGRGQDIGSELRRALEDRRLETHYQPQFDLLTGRVRSVEALSRWPHAERGHIPPSEFIPVAEATGLIRKLTMSVLESALRDWARWRAHGVTLDLSVNLSAGDLLDRTFPRAVVALLREHRLPASRLTLEVTESTLIVDSQGASAALEELRAAGVRLAIDDFGTGYSSLSYLRSLPVDEVKIDRSFVTALGRDDRDAVIVGSVVDLAERLGMRSVAEGVDSEQALGELRRLGCDFVQGFVLATPMAGPDFQGWMLANPTPSASAVPKRILLPEVAANGAVPLLGSSR
jgi:diguanylate cyclase (GGDEF)-like protein